MNNKERTQPFGCVLSLGKGEEWKHERYDFAAEQMRSKYRACIVGSKYGYITDWLYSLRELFATSLRDILCFAKSCGRIDSY